MVALIAFLCGVLTGAAILVIVILAFGLLHGRLKLRGDRGLADNPHRPQSKSGPAAG